MRRVLISLAIAAASALPAGAQSAMIGSGTELRSFVGAFIPTGSQRNDFKSAAMVGAQAAQELSSNVHLLGSVAWTKSNNKFASFTNAGTNIWQYDAGIEVNAIRSLDDEWLWRPLVGIGVGGRTYDYQAANVGSNTCTAGYANVGTEFQRKVVALRFDAREYLYCFESPVTAKKSTRNDLGLTLGLVYHFR